MEIRESFLMRDWEIMYDFLGNNYRPDIALRAAQLYEWQFQVDALRNKTCMVCAWDGNRLVAILGYIPTLVFWGDFDQPVQGVWCANWQVEKGYQHGLGWLLLRKLQEMYPILLGVGASSETERIVKRMGWTFCSQLPRYLCVLDFDKTIKMIDSEISTDDLQSMVFKASTSNPPQLCQLTPQVTDYKPNWELYPAMAYGTIRSMQYFQWRYFSHPVFKYFVLTAGSLNRPAVVVYRIERAFGQCEAQVARIVEFFHPNDTQGQADGLALIKFVLSQLQVSGCVYADFIGSSDTYGQTLIEAGWQREPADRQILPVRLSPIEQKPWHLNLEFGVVRGLQVPTIDKMYVTKSDGDGDRPTRLLHLLEKS
ncbi:MAG: hypothetical protein EAZ09_12965 [Oscillatoriales cyanobacterium]|nr:MAG: hypothetical protein EAZ18_15790 [Oscillatoriales cyanobacterium]TAH21102.1 MAG: hypothetical protein EAZ09_12965 [Oscillatoriales cyanobacterium]